MKLLDKLSAECSEMLSGDWNGLTVDEYIHEVAKDNTPHDIETILKIAKEQYGHPRYDILLDYGGDCTPYDAMRQNIMNAIESGMSQVWNNQLQKAVSQTY